MSDSEISQRGCSDSDAELTRSDSDADSTRRSKDNNLSFTVKTDEPDDGRSTGVKEVEFIAPRLSKQCSKGKLLLSNPSWRTAQFRFFHRLGNMRVLFEYNSRAGMSFRILIGPYWKKLMLSYILLFSTTYILHTHVNIKILRSMTLFLSFSAILFLTLTATSDPGIMKKEKEQKFDDWTFSGLAESWGPPHAIYCPECNLLIRKFFQFSSWTGTVIGDGNLWWYRGLQVSVTTLVCYDVLLLFVGVATGHVEFTPMTFVCMVQLFLMVFIIIAGSSRVVRRTRPIKKKKSMK